MLYYKSLQGESISFSLAFSGPNCNSGLIFVGNIFKNKWRDIFIESRRKTAQMGNLWSVFLLVNDSMCDLFRWGTCAVLSLISLHYSRFPPDVHSCAAEVCCQLHVIMKHFYNKQKNYNLWAPLRQQLCWCGLYHRNICEEGVLFLGCNFLAYSHMQNKSSFIVFLEYAEVHGSALAFL